MCIPWCRLNVCFIVSICDCIFVDDSFLKEEPIRFIVVETILQIVCLLKTLFSKIIETKTDQTILYINSIKINEIVAFCGTNQFLNAIILLPTSLFAFPLNKRFLCFDMHFVGVAFFTSILNFLLKKKRNKLTAHSKNSPITKH